MNLPDYALTAAWQPPDPLAQELHRPPTVCKAEQWLAGLDLGQQADPSALVLLKQTKVQQGQDKRRYYDALALKRWPLKTNYFDIIEDLYKMFALPQFAGQVLAVDMTGVGRPVVDVMRKKRVNAQIVPISITAGHASKIHDTGVGWCVSKRELVSVLHTLLGGRRFGGAQPLLQIAMPEPTTPAAKEHRRLAEQMVKEFQTFKTKINLQTGHESLEAWREADHDDLVLACACAAWVGERTQQRFTMA